jgi:hypothetical protein
VCTRRSSDHTSSRSASLTGLRVSPPPASPGCAGDGFFEFPRSPHPSALQVAKSPGCPESLTVLPRLSMHSSGLPEFCIFRLFRRWVFEFPRIPHPSALPPVESPGFPVPSTLASPCDESSGFPSSSSSGCRRWFFEFPRVPHPSVPPSSNLRVAPALRLKLRLSIDSPGLPGSSIFRLRRRWFFEFPRITHPSAALAVKLRVSPSPCSSSIAC